MNEWVYVELHSADRSSAIFPERPHTPTHMITVRIIHGTRDVYFADLDHLSYHKPRENADQQIFEKLDFRCFEPTYSRALCAYLLIGIYILVSENAMDVL